ncbi:MAG: LysM peptidoglycan-binding domain-containing protein [Gammaproteobacteria bacterium]|nr:LysM peptidoglycan-binding domain-containing protein [Gammaproteobacteria bacterium]
MTRMWRRASEWYIALLISLFSSLGSAQDDNNWLIENAPQSYRVQAGDTLWDIACRFLRDPWRWQQIWQANPAIEDPDRIYPGDRIVLSYQEGQPRLQLERSQNTRILNKQTGIIKLRPRVRELPVDRAIPAIPLHVINPFLNESRVVTPSQAKHCPPVIALDEDHIVIGAGDRFYVSRMSSLEKEDVYAVFRPEKTYIDPKTKAFLGVEGLLLGKAQVERAGEPARLILTQSFAEVKIGDRVTHTLKEKISPYFVPKYPQGEPEGQIISVFGGVTQIGQYQVLVVTGGTDRCREVGDVLAIYQTKKDIPSRLLFETDRVYRFPPLRIGTSVVFRVFDKVSYVLVMSATRPIYLLDEVGKP